MIGLDGYLIGAAVAIIAFVATYLRGRMSGAKIERQKQAASEQRAKDIHAEIQNDVGAMSPEQVRAELAKRAAK
jgi:hypothetical protein